MEPLRIRAVTGKHPHIGALLRLTWQRIRESIYAGVQRDGFTDLNPAHVALFRYESLDGGRPTEVAESMQITKQSVAELLRHLKRCGYAEYKRDPSDRRARVICLTPRGRLLEAAAHKHAIVAESQLKRELGRRRFRELYDTLLKINGLAN